MISGAVVVSGDRMNASLDGPVALAAMALWFGFGVGYHTVLEWRYGRTLGKYLVDIRVADSTGGPPSLRASFVRNGLRVVDWLPAFYVVGVAAIAASDRARRVGDRVTGTAVVR